MDQLLNKIECLKACIAKEQPDIMLFTEVIPKAQKNPILESQMNITGYDCYVNFNFTDSDLGASGKRGVAVYVKSDIQSDEVTFETPYEDHVWVKIKLRGNDSLLCGCIYRSPSKEKSKAIETTEKVCKIIMEAAQRKNSDLLV